MSEKPASKPEAKSESTATLEAAIKAVAEQIIPSAIAAAITANNASRPAQAAPPKPPPIGRCHECGQLVSACDKKHVQMVVYPLKYPQYADYFPGVFVNGVRYLSNDDGHPITVPAVAQAEIAGHVAGFERNEHEMANGRVAERHSGVVSPHGTAFNPASAAWR